MSRRDDLYLREARRRLCRVQEQYVRGLPSGRAALSSLRTAFSKPVGGDVGVSGLCLSGMIDGVDLDPRSPLGRASWMAFCLYGFHQQSQSGDRMQRNGVSFASALRRVPSRSGLVHSLEGLRGVLDPVEAARLLLPVVRVCASRKVGFDHALLALELESVGSERFRVRVLPSWVAGLAG